MDLIEAHADFLGISLWELFAAVGVPYTYWNQWQSGRWGPTERTAARLLDYKPRARRGRAA